MAINRRGLFGRLFGGLVASSVPMEQTLRPLQMHSAILRTGTMTLDTSAVTKVVNAALRGMQYSLPNGSFLVIPPLTDDAEDDTMDVVSSTG